MGRELQPLDSSGLVLGVDPGIRGGAGIAMVRAGDGLPVLIEKVVRDDALSTIQMMAVVRDRVRELIRTARPIAVAREDHVFPGSIEKIARVILRRMNGILDMVFFDEGYLASDRMFHFPVNTWKAITGMPGDLGKEHAAQVPGEMPGRSRRRNTTANYLAAVSRFLAWDHHDIDEADAHGVARAAWVYHGVRTGRLSFRALPDNSQGALWDQKRAGGVTLARAKREDPEIFGRPQSLVKVLRTFVT